MMYFVRNFSWTCRLPKAQKLATLQTVLHFPTQCTVVVFTLCEKCVQSEGGMNCCVFVSVLPRFAMLERVWAVLLCCYVVSVTVRCGHSCRIGFWMCGQMLQIFRQILVISVRSPNFVTAFRVSHWDDFLWRWPFETLRCDPTRKIVSCLWTASDDLRNPEIEVYSDTSANEWPC